MSGKDQIANSSTLQDLSLKIDSSTRAKLYKISVFGASTGRLFSTSQLYTYSEVDDVILDNSTNTICPRVVDNFVCNGEEIDPGWRVYVGLENYQRLFLNERIKSSLDIVTKWTFQFALLSVFFAFSVGLFLSVTLNKEKLKFKRVYRSLYILPYAIPAFVSVLVWKGILLSLIHI